MSKKTKKLKRMHFLFKACSFMVVLGPLLVYFAMNFGRYVSSVEDAVKLSFGGIAVLVIVAFVALGKMKVPGRLVTALILCALCWLLASVLGDLTVITTIWLGSQAADVMIFSPLVQYTKRRLDMSETADATAAVTMDAVKTFLGRT